MRKHFVGNVIRFEDQPEQMELFVDIPLFNQEQAPLEILISMEVDDIDENAKPRLEAFNSLPDDLKEIINNLRKGTLKHEINFREDSFTNKALRQNFNRLAFVFIIGLLLICATLLMIYQPQSTGVKVLFYSSVIIIVWTGLKLLFNTKFR